MPPPRHRRVPQPGNCRAVPPGVNLVDNQGDPMQFQPQGKPSLGIVFDSDLGNTIDDALALVSLYGFQGKGEARVIAVSTTKPSLNAAIFADILVRFYTGDPGPFGGPTPIGLTL